MFQESDYNSDKVTDRHIDASLHKGKIPHNQCPRYDTKQSDGEPPVMRWEMRRTHLLLSLSDLGAVAPDRVLCMGQIELNCVFILN